MARGFHRASQSNSRVSPTTRSRRLLLLTLLIAPTRKKSDAKVALPHHKSTDKNRPGHVAGRAGCGWRFAEGRDSTALPSNFSKRKELASTSQHNIVILHLWCTKPSGRLLYGSNAIPKNVLCACTMKSGQKNKWYRRTYLVLPTVSFPTMTTLSGRVTAVVPPLKMSSKYCLTARIPPVTNASGGCSHGFWERFKNGTPSSLSRREANATGRVPPGTHDIRLDANVQNRAVNRRHGCACIYTTHACMYTSDVLRFQLRRGWNVSPADNPKTFQVGHEEPHLN